MKRFNFIRRPLLWASLALAMIVGGTAEAEAQWRSGYRSNYGNYGRSYYGNYGSGRVYHGPSMHYDRTYHADSLHWTPRRGLHTHGHYHTTPHYTPGHYDYRHGNHVHGNRHYHR